MDPRFLLDICSGTGSVSKVAREMGWVTTTLDNDPQTNPDCTHFLYNCLEIGNNNSKIDRKVYLKSVSVIFVLALFQNDLKNAISQTHLDFSMPTFPKCPSSNQHFFKKSTSYPSPAPATSIKTTANGFSSYELFIKIIDF